MRRLLVDQNTLNAGVDGARAQLAADPDVEIIVPDVAFVEMCKGPHWDLTMQLCMAQFAGYEKRISMTGAVGELLDHELQTKTPITVADVVPAKVQVVLQTFVNASTMGTQDEARALLRQHVAQTQIEVESDLLNAQQVKDSTLALANGWRQALPQVIKALASSQATPADILNFVQVEAESIALRVATDRLGLSATEAAKFVAAKPMVLRYLLATGRHSVLAARMGAGAMAGAEKELNNRLDLEYGILASYFAGFHSSDKRATRAYQDLLAMLERPSRERLIKSTDCRPER